MKANYQEAPVAEVMRVPVPVALMRELINALNEAKRFCLKRSTYFRDSYELVSALERFQDHGRAPLDTFTMTTNPDTCPRCGVRSVLLDEGQGDFTPPFTAWCPACWFVYELL